MTRVADLDFDTLRAAVVRATDAARRRSYSPLVDDLLHGVTDEAGAVKALRNGLLIAVLRYADSLDTLSLDGPLGHAMVRVMRHPAATPLPEVAVQDTLRGPDAGPTLHALVAASPTELTWERSAVAADLFEELRRHHGGVELGDLTRPPPIWLREWRTATATASALFLHVTLEAMGLLACASPPPLARPS